MHALALGNLQHTLDRIFLLVEDDVVRAMRTRELGLLARRRRPDDGGAARLRDLREHEAEPARDGVHEDDVARLDVVRFAHECRRGETLQDRSGRRQRRYGLRHGDGRGPGDRDVFGEHAPLDLGRLCEHRVSGEGSSYVG